MNSPLRAPSFDDFDFQYDHGVASATVVDSSRLHHCRGAWPVRAVFGERATDTSYFRTNSVSLVADNQGALDDIYAMVVTDIQQLVADLDALDVVAVPEKTCDFTAISAMLR
jgi:hypothetical protein